jgi:arsenate reductase
VSERSYNVLFLCTGNSARSIIGEALIEKLGGERFRGFSAGSTPKGAVHPMALEVLSGMGFATEGLRSKSWSEFAGADAPEMDFVFTVCDNAATESCPVWPGKPMTANWGIADPAVVEGEAQLQAFLEAVRQLRRRIELFLSLPLDSIDRMSLANRLRDIGKTGGNP